MAKESEIFSGDDVLLLPTLEGVSGLSDLEVFVQGLADYIEVDLPFEIPNNPEFLFANSDDILVLDGDEKKVALVAGENISIEHIQGDSVLFINGTDIEFDLASGSSTLFWEGGSENNLSLNFHHGEITLVLPDRAISAESQIELIENAVFIDGYDTGIIFSSNAISDVQIEFVDLNGNSVFHNIDQSAQVSAISVEHEISDFEFKDEDPSGEDALSVESEWQVSDLEIFEKIEDGVLAELDGVSPSVDLGDLEDDLFDAPDVTMVNITPRNSNRSDLKDMELMPEEAMIYRSDDESRLEFGEAEIDWFLEVNDFADFTIDDPLSLLDDL